MMRFSIKNKIIVFGLLLSLIFGLSISISIFIYLNSKMTKDRVANIEKLANEQTHVLLGDFKQYQLVVKLFSTKTKVLEYLQEQTEARRVELDATFHDYTDYDANVLSLYLIGKDGKTLVSTDKSFVDQNYSFREYFKSAISGKPFLESALGKTTNKFGYYFSYPVFSNNSKVEGVVVLKLNNKYFDETIVDSELAKNNTVMLVDDMGIVMASNNSELLLSSLGTLASEVKDQLIKENRFLGKDIKPLQYDELQNVLKNYTNPKSVSFMDKIDGEQENVYISKVDGLPFYLVVETRLEDLKKEIFSAILIMCLFVFLATFIILLLGYWLFSRLIIKPIRKLDQAAVRISEGNYSQLVQIKTNDELEDLADSFNIMTKNIIKAQLENKQYSQKLEEKIEEKTKDLQDKVNVLNKTREAILNVAEDAESEQKKSGDLAKDLAKFKLAFESTSEQIVIADRGGIVIYCNPATEKLTGYKLNEAIGTKAGKMWGGMMDKNFYKKMWDTILLEKKVFIGELVNKRKNGEVYTAAVNISPVLDDAGEVEFFVAVERDVTVEREIDRMKTEFISVASHQLRTPLTAIKLFTEMLGDEEVGKLEPKQAEYVRDIHESTDRMVKLVNDLLNVARLESGRLKIEPVPLPIEKILTDSISEFELVAKAKNGKITFDKPAELLPLIPLDDTLVRQVFHNLVGNSLKYAKVGAVLVQVKLTTTELSPDAKTMINSRFGGTVEPSVVVSVSDNGIGIPEEVQKRIFEKFFRADNAVKSAAEGTGLGLYICKMVVDASNGHIWFESVIGKGTTFYVTLPLKGMVARQGEKSLA